MNSLNAMTWEGAVDWLKKQPDKKELVEACYYDDPLESAAQRYYQSPEWKAVREIAKSASGTALDIGSGRGISAYALARDGWRVTALEPDPSDSVGSGAIRKLSQDAGLSINVCQEWGESLPFADASFDLVYCRAVLHHARNLEDLCKEVSRVLKPGGRFIATREHVISRRADLAAFLHSHPLHALYGGEHAYLLTEYTSAIRKAGLRLSRVLNPMQSDINLQPLTRAQLKQSIAKKLPLPVIGPIAGLALDMLGALSTRPGRLYSFVAAKN